MSYRRSSSYLISYGSLFSTLKTDFNLKLLLKSIWIKHVPVVKRIARKLLRNNEIKTGPQIKTKSNNVDANGYVLGFKCANI
jgi:hypothetical protein